MHSSLPFEYIPRGTFSSIPLLFWLIHALEAAFPPTPHFSDCFGKRWLKPKALFGSSLPWIHARFHAIFVSYFKLAFCCLLLLLFTSTICYFYPCLYPWFVIVFQFLEQTLGFHEKQQQQQKTKNRNKEEDHLFCLAFSRQCRAKRTIIRFHSMLDWWITLPG